MSYCQPIRVFYIVFQVNLLDWNLIYLILSNIICSRGSLANLTKLTCFSRNASTKKVEIIRPTLNDESGRGLVDAYKAYCELHKTPIRKPFIAYVNGLGASG